MKIRTIYFFAPQMNESISFWEKFLGFPPHKKSNYWSEFKCENINLGLIAENNNANRSSCVPVFEVRANELENTKQRALDFGATIYVDITKHPDKQSYVLKDPFGNEFEITKFHD